MVWVAMIGSGSELVMKDWWCVLLMILLLVVFRFTNWMN